MHRREGVQDTSLCGEEHQCGLKQLQTLERGAGLQDVR